MSKTKLIHEIRAVKSKKELANIVKAQRISEQVLRDTLKQLRDGVTEIQIANFIKKSFVRYGESILSFPPIVAFGKGTGDIHHEPGKAKLTKGARRGEVSIIMFDFGTTVNHYCSDMTRTFFWGRPSKRQVKIYNDVLEAQERAIRLLSKGEKRAGVVDKAARAFLNKKYGKKNFLHGLGHGVGTVIHEWPNFKPKSKDVLPVGCVMTIEPGLYFKNFGGVRIEDMILITAKGIQNLTKFPKTLESAILQ